MFPVQSQNFHQPFRPIVEPHDRVSQINLVATAIIGATLLAILPWIIAVPATAVLFGGYMVTHFPSSYYWTERTVEPYFPPIVPFMGGFQHLYRTIPHFVDRHIFSRNEGHYATLPGRAPVMTGERTQFSRGVVPHPLGGPNPPSYHPPVFDQGRALFSGGGAPPLFHPAAEGGRALVGRR